MGHVHDVAIVGAGAMGSAAAWALTRSDLDVVVLEQFDLSHRFGGSHGATRIFRVGTEQTHYLDMAEQARGLWGELQAETGTALMTVTGAVEHGLDDDQIRAFAGLLESRGIEHEVLEPAAAAERRPGMRFDGSVLHQAGGGILHADRVVAGLHRLAQERGATFQVGTRADRITVDQGGGRVTVETAGGAVHARQVVVTVGCWAPRLLSDVVDLPPIRVTQEQPRIFEPVEAPHEWPCFVQWRHERGEWGHYESYGLMEGSGVKVGLHASGPPIDPDRRDFRPEPRRDEALLDYVRTWFPGLDPDRSVEISCLYDNTDNGDFVIDRSGPVIFATGFNGEGFKFVPLIGQLLRDMTLGRANPPASFALARHLAARDLAQ
jgi:sarcosine oxidase